MKKLLTLLITVALLATTAFAQEAKLIAVLKSDAPQKEKADACRELARIGTKDAVPTLAALLADEQLSHMARYALEPIPDPAVDTAFRAALDKLKGRPLVGVINSIGVRHDAKASDALTRFLKNADADVAQAAAGALGNIGTPAASKALLAVLGKGAPAVQLAVCDGLLRCAAAFPPSTAMTIYDRLRSTPVPQQIQIAALRGAIIARQAKGVPLLMEALRGDDYALALAAIRTSMELPGADVTKALAAELGKLTGDKQRVLIGTLGDRRDAAALPALLVVAKNGPGDLRVAAVKSITQIGNASVVPAFAEMAVGDNAEVAAAARTGLASFSGSEADAAITGMLTAADPKTRLIAFELIGQRRMKSAIPALLRAAADADATLAGASLKTLGEVAGPAEVPALIKILLTTPATAAAEGALVTVCTRPVGAVTGNLVIQKALYGDLPDGRKADVTTHVAALVKNGGREVAASNENFGDPAGGVVKELRVDYTINGTPGTQTVKEGDTMTFAVNATPPAFTEALVAALPQATPQPKMALLRILRSVGGTQALSATRAAAQDTNPEIREVALHNLCEWPTADVLPDLAEIVRHPASPKFKILALRGQLRLIPQQTVSLAQKLAALQAVLPLVERTEEKRLALAALGDIPIAESLALVMPEVANPALKEEASQAAVAIGEKLVGKQPALVTDAMQKVVKATENKKLAKRAQALLHGPKK